MGKRTGKPVGRPPKPDGEKMVKRLISFKPALWKRIEKRVPEGERSAFIAGAVEKELGEGDLELPDEA